MTAEWTTERNAEAVAAIERLARCPDLAAIALVLTWFYWSRKPEVSVESHAWYAVQMARQGRDLPRIGATRRRDALRHSTQGAGMDEVLETRPGPEQEVAEAEAYQLWLETLTDREAEAADMYVEGRKNMEVAARLNVSQGRATQIRAKMAEKWKRLSE